MTGRPKQHFFHQNGRTVFKEIVSFSVKHITQHLQKTCLCINDIKRFWLHQANKHMNDLITKKIFNGTTDFIKAPIILDSYANTGAAGSIIVFHKHQENFVSGEKELICAFGAGYSIGSILVEKC